MGSRLRDSVRYLFEFFCEVAPGSEEKDPYMIRKYPEVYKNEQELKDLPKFTFPCPFEDSFVQHYSFVLTSVDSKYTFCFCRYDNKSNTSLVLLSHLPWHDIFYKLLNCIASLLAGPNAGELGALLAAVRTRPPPPGHSLRVTYDAGASVFVCQPPPDTLPSIPENSLLREYYAALNPGAMVGVWAALLAERRVLVTGRRAGRVAACAMAANQTLYPMTWQHIYIPLLPKHLVDYLLAPMPFLIGVPRAVLDSVRVSDLGDVVVLDVDSSELATPHRDLEALPADTVSTLKKALSDKNALGDGVSRAFLRALVSLIGGYRDAIRISCGEQISFSAARLLAAAPPPRRAFLQRMLHAQIFQQFIEERLELLNSGRGFSDEFEVECSLAAGDAGAGGGGAGGGGRGVKAQYKRWLRAVTSEGGALLRQVKDKMRAGGRRVTRRVRGWGPHAPRSQGSRDNANHSRASCGSATPVSTPASSPPPSPPASPPPSPPASPPPCVDLLTEMEFLFAPPPAADPPLVPARRYAIVATRRLVELAAPAPPPRPRLPARLLRDPAPAPRPPRARLAFQREGRLTVTLPAPPAPRPPAPRPPDNESVQWDLIQLDDPPPAAPAPPPAPAAPPAPASQRGADSALLHEYGLDFTQFGLSDPPAPAATPAAWTTFN
ncbi:DENN domain-containing protein 1A isoform X2 [Plutella xylostella]|uniref:DENN domain-containing protein 1A isoform X2 n=1 Tax=Plutella xylostella TaxID=51655 RepID=UPI0018D0FB3E|nr:DENN domain-containing protein 1A isoform X2 [Plutella xylostella]